jgi:2-amino-4-hydroxy-6-hydroxymethyldihydropteridine diphosphokinase
MRSFLGMGSNLGDRLQFLRRAVAGVPELVAVSPLYESEPMGGPADQPWFLNLVVELHSTRSPRQLLGLCQELERAAGRERAVRFGPRTLDVDVLLVDDLRIDEPDLVVPHPRMWERRFVLRPLADLAPELVPAAAAARAGGRVRAAGSLWDDRGQPCRPDRPDGPESGSGPAAVGG